jgi:ATP-dependent DNA helicase PIF1
MIDLDNIVLSPQQKIVFDAMMEGKNVALFGDAGSGKSVIVKKFLQEKARSGDVVCLTPTGLAARNIGQAQTIHSFFSIDPGCVGDLSPLNRRLLNILPKVRTILIDEISMVRSDLFDIMEQCLRLVPIDDNFAPFGGRQIIVVGDFKQLPPVVSDEHIAEFLEYYYNGEYAFKSKAWLQADFLNYYLEGTFRQDSDNYYHILQNIRYGINIVASFRELNQQVFPLSPGSGLLANPKTLALCSRKVLASEINRKLMSYIPGKEYLFEASVKGKFPINEYPTDHNLKLKIGTKVMILANKKETIQANDLEYEYVNGDIGKIVAMYDDAIIVRLGNDKSITVQKNTWNYYEYDLVEVNGEVKIEARIVGSFCQFPVAIAYASTIHKAQGQTLNSVYVVLGKGCFAPGQLYTALSRVRNLDCLFLASDLRMTDIIPDPMVDEFYHTRIWEPL